MTKMDDISKAMLGWYGLSSMNGRRKHAAADTESSDTSQELFETSTSDVPGPIATALSNVRRNGGLNSPRQRSLLSLPNKPARPK